MLHTAVGIPASIPSPPASTFSVFGVFTVHYYALCIIAGIVVAVLLTNYRLTRRGAEPWVVFDIGLIAVPLGIVGARIFHVLTHPGFYFSAGSNPWNPFAPGSVWAIWEGGIAIYGSLIGGAVGAILGCKWTGIRFWTFADALAPGLLLAQAFGRFGNWFNQELFGLPTDLPWGLEISPSNSAFPPGLATSTLFHPTFLYEVLWNSFFAVVLILAGRAFTLQWGRLFGLYLVLYGAGRVIWESIRIDPSEVYLGLRSNVWASILAIVVGLVIMVVQKRRHTGYEPSPYVPGRGWVKKGAVSSEESTEYVDVSEPPTSAEAGDEAKSTVAAT